MTDREIIIHLAEKVMGWHVYPLTKSGYDQRLHEHRLIENIEGKWNHFPPGKPGKLWNPPESIADAFEVGEALACRGGSMKRFSAYLLAVMEIDTPLEGQDVYAISHATARQRCLAIVEATR